MYQPLFSTLFAGRCVIDTPRRRDSMMRAAWCQGQSQFAGYYCYSGEPEVGLAGKTPFRYAGHAQVV